MQVLLDLLEARLGGLDPSVLLVHLFEHVDESVLPSLGWQFDISADAWAGTDEAGRRELIATAIARQRKRGTAAAIKRALAVLGYDEVHLHKDTALRADGTLPADGTFVAGADAHPFAYWIVLTSDFLHESVRQRLVEVAQAWGRLVGHVARFYYVLSAEDFGDLTQYERQPFSNSLVLEDGHLLVDGGDHVWVYR
jgi:hypothetical protein